MKKMILIIGYQNYSKKIGNAKVQGLYPFDVSKVAFIPSTLDEDIEGFRRVISLIYKEEAKNKIQSWIKHNKTGKNVAEELLTKKNVILVNVCDDHTDQADKIKKWIIDNQNSIKVLILGGEAYKELYDDLAKYLNEDDLAKYPNPIERAADDVFWRNIDYKDIQKKYDDEQKIIHFFD